MTETIPAMRRRPTAEERRAAKPLPNAGHLIAMWRAGKPAYQIAEVLNVRPATVRRWADRLGMPRDRNVVRQMRPLPTDGLTAQQKFDYDTFLAAGFRAAEALEMATQNKKDNAQ